MKIAFMKKQALEKKKEVNFHRGRVGRTGSCQETEENIKPQYDRVSKGGGYAVVKVGSQGGGSSDSKPLLISMVQTFPPWLI